MRYGLSRFIARLRSHYPALALLPGLILSQAFASHLQDYLLILIILALLALLVKSKNFLGLFSGLLLGLISSISFTNKSIILNKTETRVIARILHQGLRFSKPGLEQFGLLVLQPYQREDSPEPSSDLITGLKFQCRAISLPWKNIAEIKAGELVVLQGTFTLFPKNLWPWEFDAQLLRRGYSGTCKLAYVARLGFEKNNFLDRFRDLLLKPYFRTLGDDEVAGMLLSLSLGVRDLISSNSEKLFKELGISHVLVLSGMQIGLIFFGVAFLFRKLLLLFLSNGPRLLVLISNSVAAIVSALLVHLTYYEASALRAWIACVLIAIANNSERRTGILRGSIASFILLALIWPGCWAEAGVQLSFAALFGIALGQDFSKTKLIGILMPCFFATFFTSIVSALWFNSLTISSLISNLVLAPWFAVLGCYMGFILVVAAYFDLPFVDELAILSKWLVIQSLEVVEYAHAVLPQPIIITPTYSLFLFLSLAILCVRYFYYKGRAWAKEYNLFTVKNAQI